MDRAALKAKAKKQIHGNIGILFLCGLVAEVLISGPNIIWRLSVAPSTDMVISGLNIVSGVIAPAVTMGIGYNHDLSFIDCGQNTDRWGCF